MDFSRKLSFFAVGAFSLYSVTSAHADHSWGSYHWARTNDPFTLQVIDSTSNSWFVEMDMSLTEWSQSQALELVVTETDNSDQSRNMCSKPAGKIRVCNSNYGSTGWLGLATIGIDANGHIDRGSAKVNDYYGSYWGSQAMKNHVMCQEIGHLFGLGHTSENGTSQQTCMDYSSSQYSQWPNQHDFDQLDLVIYNHFDNYNSYDDALDGGGSGGGSDPAPDPEPDPEPDGGGGGGGKSGKGNGGTKPCKGKKCTEFADGQKVQHIPPRAVRVNKNLNHEIWVSARKDGGLWVHHVRLIDELADHGHDDDSGEHHH